MASITREDIESFVTRTEAGTHPMELETRFLLYQLLVFNRIEGHLARLAENTSEMPELARIADQLNTWHRTGVPHER